ncbi:MAG: tripartite tricarboxylate transporter permease [Chloroflexi bacterium]|nr:tripartite tricarboxylate transporter permease [Chloroflexota bacterium]
MLEQMLNGFQVTLQWQNLIALFLGSLVGYAVGALPGLNPSMTIALMLPFTFTLSPLTSLIFLTSLYGAAEYGGGITSITLNVPGEAGAAPTCFDGYPLAQKGQPAKALGISIIASGIAGLVTTVALIVVAVPLASVALSFGPPEYFALAVFGLTVVASLAGRSVVKGLMTVTFGLLVTSIGIDPITGTPRYTFTMQFFEGIPFIAGLVGLFAISEVLMTMEEIWEKDLSAMKVSGALPTLKETLGTWGAIVRGSIIGFVIGLFPGSGKAVASFIAYNEERRASKHPELFGTGVLEGVAAPEAANNAVVSGALVPLLTLGIPGSAATAIMIGALTIQGLQPGPMLFVKQAPLVYGLFASLMIGNIMMTIIGLAGTQLWTQVVAVPKAIMMPIVLAVCLLAAYAESGEMFQVWVAMFFGVLGYLLRKFGFPVAPIVLAMVLGPTMETNFRRSLIVSDEGLAIFFSRPISAVVLGLTLASLAYQVHREVKAWRQMAARTVELGQEVADPMEGRL